MTIFSLIKLGANDYGKDLFLFACFWFAYFLGIIKWHRIDINNVASLLCPLLSSKWHQACTILNLAWSSFLQISHITLTITNQVKDKSVTKLQSCVCVLQKLKVLIKQCPFLDYFSIPRLLNTFKIFWLLGIKHWFVHTNSYVEAEDKQIYSLGNSKFNLAMSIISSLSYIIHCLYTHAQ